MGERRRQNEDIENKTKNKQTSFVLRLILICGAFTFVFQTYGNVSDLNVVSSAQVDFQ